MPIWSIESSTRETISTKTYMKILAELENIEFLDLQSPKIRKIDKIWAEELFGEQSQIYLEKAKNLLQHSATRRNP